MRPKTKPKDGEGGDGGDPEHAKLRAGLNSAIIRYEGGCCVFAGRFGRESCPSVKDLNNILGSVGAEADDDKIEFLLSEVKGKDITELIASGREKLASVPAGGGAVAYSAPAGGAGGGSAPAAEEQKKEEKVEEKEESDDDMGFSLFD